ncbi:N-acetylated-alpha-linked acidic dipeptidase 2 [Elysia marginata]|uniref:N-acetylated-alpha-linked acidic dipeptidase 2 n=1 Tax=Elysia marginata TaxID=1093978 RepID=A0AAV4EXH8_9GAST|nr:N-acetylated-alpha-linked acidic dipeptidase 2 [Elysia marginata]
MPSRGYIAGKPVSRWEADSDNIDIEYKNLDKPIQQFNPCPQCLSGKRGIIVKGVIILVIFLVGLVVGYLIRRNVHEVYIAPKVKQKYIGIQQDYDPTIRDELQARVTHVGNFEDSLHMLTTSVRMSGTSNAVTILGYIKAWWNTFNFDSVTVKNYTVLLSYPNYTAFGENHVALKAENLTIFQTRTNNSNLHPDISPFSAYSHSGNVLGDIVYCNYGRREDYKWLVNKTVKISGVIHLIRYGKIHPSNKVRLAEEHGAAGVILYPDPADHCAPGFQSSPPTGDGTPGTEDYDSLSAATDNSETSWWLHGDQVPSEHVRYWLTGDPATPDYPALSLKLMESMTPKLICETSRVKVYNYVFSLRNLGGTSTPPDFHGGLNVSYNTGPGYLAPDEKQKVELSVSNVLLAREIDNVIAIIRGKYEKDHYVVVGAHMDAWGYGGVDAGTSYAVIMDLARTFHDQFNQGWRPRRTIIFAFWDASKYGHVGAYEWTQEFEKQLSSGGVAYIDIDCAIRGNYSFYAESNPLLYDVIMQATQSVTWYGEGTSGKEKTVYDVWRERGRRSPDRPEKPWINSPSGDGDHSPFFYRLGMSSLLTAFTYDTKAYPYLEDYPAHNTLQDNMQYVLNIDPGYKLHSALVQV